MAPSVTEIDAGEPVGPFTVAPLLIMSCDTDAEASFIPNGEPATSSPTVGPIPFSNRSRASAMER